MSKKKYKKGTKAYKKEKHRLWKYEELKKKIKSRKPNWKDTKS